MNIIKEFELIPHGFVDENEFEEPPATPHAKILTGRGMNELEAFNDVIEQLTSHEEGVNISEIEKEAGKLDEEYYDQPFEPVFDEDEEGSYSEKDSDGDVWYFYSIKYTMKK